MTVWPAASVPVMVWGRPVEVMTKPLPNESVVVRGTTLLVVLAVVAPAAAAELTILPPEATCTLARGDAEVTVEPSAFVPVTTAAGSFVEVVMVLP